MHAGTGILAVVASACMALALLRGVRQAWSYAHGMMQHFDVVR